MIEVVYRREVSYPQPAVLEHVHPRSFGRARMVSTNHNIIAWELEWPPVLGLIRLQSTFAQEYRPPWGIHATITRGFLRGTEISVEINKTDAGTLVVEHYRIPLPAWLRGGFSERWFEVWIGSGKRTWRSSCLEAAGRACRVSIIEICRSTSPNNKVLHLIIRT
jgi:hypothetical protein